MRTKLVVLIVVAILLSGCFGGSNVERKLDSIILSAGIQNIVEPGETIKITAGGKAETGHNMAVEPVWSLDDETKGTLTQGNPAEFTAAADASGTVTITATVDDVSEDITLTIAVMEMTNVVARWGWEPNDYGGPDGQEVRATDEGVFRGGYSSEYFFIGYNDPGQWVEWDMAIPEAGKYRLVVRYSTHADPSFVRRNFTLREVGEDLANAYIDETYDLPSGRVDNDSDDKDNDEWMFYLSDILELKEGEQSLRMKFVDNPDDESNQFSNVLMVAFVAADPEEAMFDEAEYIAELDGSLGL